MNKYFFLLTLGFVCLSTSACPEFQEVKPVIDFKKEIVDTKVIDNLSSGDSTTKSKDLFLDVKPNIASKTFDGGVVQCPKGTAILCSENVDAGYWRCWGCQDEKELGIKRGN